MKHAILFLTLVLMAHAPDLRAQEPAPATIFIAKEIITMNRAQPLADAVAIIGNDIVAVGTREEVTQALGDRPIEINRTFKGKVMVPGLIEQHIHPMLSSLMLTAEVISIEDWDLSSGLIPAVHDRETYLKRLEKAVARLSDPAEPLIVWGFHRYFHGSLTRADLDSISPTRPILVWHRSGHEFTFNTAAMTAYGITPDFVAQTSHTAQEQSNFDEGHFWEQGLTGILSLILPVIASEERLIAGLMFTKAYLHQSGVTTAAEPGGIVSKDIVDAQNAIFGGADTPFRFYYIPDGKTVAQLHLDGDMIGETEKFLEWGAGMTSYLPKQVKLFADGAIFSQLMQMKDGYLDGHHGEWLINPDIFAKAFRTYWDAGYQIHIHQNGDAGLEMALDILEENMQRNPRDDHRTTIVHFGFSTEEQVKRIRDLGAIVSANPYYLTALADRYGEVGIGPERADQMVRLGDVARAQIPLSLHSDMPMAPGKPLYLMWAAINRTTFSGRIAGPAQRLSVDQALKAVTIDAAFSLRLENEIGSIEPGKKANFTILENSPFAVDPRAIKDIEIWGTVLEGRIQPILH